MIVWEPVLIMIFKPKGILANRKPTILMHGDKNEQFLWKIYNEIWWL